MPEATIERYVFVKLNDDYSTADGRAAVAAHTRQALAGLPGVVSFAVGVPADESSTQSWDLSIVVRFAKLDDVAPYLAHPDHRAYVDDYLVPKMAVIKYWNFDVTAS